MPESSEDVLPPKPRGRFAGKPILFLAALAIGALLAFWGLGRHVFWDDEAHTALFARNLVEFGERTAWNGRNLVGYNEGRELNRDLKFVYGAPQEVYVAAAGMKILGDSVFGARAPFVGMGILGIALTGWWGRRLVGENFPWWLPAMLLALSPAYLLYIRNCRYYAAGMFWVVLLYAAWTAAAAGAKRGDGVGFWPGAAVAVVAVLGLCSTQYVYTVAALGALPVFFLDDRFRSKKQLSLLAVVYAIGGACLLWVFFYANPLEGYGGAEEGGFYANMIGKLFYVSWWQIRDFGVFEIFAWPMLLPLALPWVVPKLAPLRGLARAGIVAAGLLFAWIVITAVVGPQTIESVGKYFVYANMQYSLPCIPLGVMISAISLAVLWKAHRVLGVAAGVLLVFSNVLYLGATRDQPRQEAGKGKVRSTLYDYVVQVTQPYESTFDALTDAMRRFPAGTTVRVFPHYLAYTPMYELPELLYCAQLTREAEVRPELRAQLPDYVFSDYLPEVCVVYGHVEIRGDDGSDVRLTPYDSPANLNTFLKEYGFEEIHVAPALWPIGDRPDIPLHWFTRPEPAAGHYGFLKIYARKGEATP